MKTCPNCNEIIGDSVETCFNCNYNFKYKMVLTKGKLKELNEKGVSERIHQQEDAIVQISKNPMFEYKVVIVNNLADGQIDQSQLQYTLDAYSIKGWKLHSIFNNELGKTSSTVSLGIIGTNINATIDQTILIFERCNKSYD